MSNRISWCDEVYVKFQSNHILLFIFVKKKGEFFWKVSSADFFRKFFSTPKGVKVYSHRPKGWIPPCQTDPERYSGGYELDFLKVDSSNCFVCGSKFDFFGPNVSSNFFDFFFSIFFYFKILVVGICLTRSKT